MRLLFLLSFLVFLAPSFSSAAINRNLKIGDLGEDVRELQVFLNKDPETLVSNSGPGSKGQETTYFGAKTEAAVNKFQLKYKDKLLKPIGLYSPTGIVGPIMRGLINGGQVTNGPIVNSTPQLAKTSFQTSENQKTIVFPLNLGNISKVEFANIASGFSERVESGQVLGASNLGYDPEPFGGEVVVLTPCDQINRLYIAVGPPVPGFFTMDLLNPGVNYMALPVNLGEYVLGIADSFPVPCTIGGTPIQPEPIGVVRLMGSS